MLDDDRYGACRAVRLRVRQMSEHLLTRREFLRDAGLGTVVLAAGCDRALWRNDMGIERIDCSREKRYWEGERPFPRGVEHPLFYTPDQIERARRRAESHEWARRFRDGQLRWIANRKILEMPDAQIRAGISEQVNFPLPRCPVDRRKRSWRIHFWEWSPEAPDRVRCKICGSVFPGPEHQPVGEIEVVGPAGGTVRYRYWEDDEGMRYFFENMLLNYTQYQVVRMADPLSIAYVLTGEIAYAQKAAVILDRLSEVYKNYPVHGLGVSYLHADRKGFYENHFYKDPPFPFVSARMGNFHASPFSDAYNAFRLAQVYDLISDSGAIERLSEVEGRDVRKTIEQDLLYEAIRHTLEIPHGSTNYDGGRINGLALVGRVLGEPDFVAGGYGLYRTLIDNCYNYDGYWHENTLNYFNMITNGILRVPDVISGPGGIDVYGEMPFLERVYTAPLGLFMPDGRTFMANDSWALSTGFARVSSQIASMGKFVEAADEIRGSSRIPVADVEYALFRRTSEADGRVTDEDLLALAPSNYLLPAAGDVILGVGRSKEAVRATLGYGPWGGHHHYDTLAIGMDVFGQELLSDIGYTHTRYREWATTVGSHNTVVVDGQEQTRESGRLLCYRPASRTRVGFVCAEAAGAFENTAVYRRTMMLVPTGPNSGYVVDLFEVKGGDVHDYLLHGSADFDQTISTEVGLRAAEAEMILRGDGTDGALYGYLKRTRAADVSQDFKVRFDGEGTQVDVRFLGVQAGRLLASAAPSIRRTREDDGKLDDFWLRTVCLRQRNETSTFVTVIEAHNGEGFVRGARVVARDGSGIVIQVEERGGVRTLAIDPMGVGLVTTLPDGRQFELRGRAGVVSEASADVDLDVIEGSRLRVGESEVQRISDYKGVVTELAGDISGTPGRSEMVLDSQLPQDGSLNGMVVYVRHPSGLETVYRVERIERESGGSRVFLADMPRFVRGRGNVASGKRSRFESTVDHPKGGAYPGCRLRIGNHVFTIRRMRGRTTFVVEEAFDFSKVIGESFEVYSTAVGDRVRIVA